MTAHPPAASDDTLIFRDEEAKTDAVLVAAERCLVCEPG
jgi:hypothetical protein